MILTPIIVIIVALMAAAVMLEYAPNSIASNIIKTFLRRRITNLDTLNGRKVIDVDELNLIEKDINGLHSVVLVAAEAQAPKESDLAPAVIDNFKEAVKYRFFISASWKQNTDTVEQTRNVFKALYQVALETAADDGPHSRIRNTQFEDVFQIHYLPIEWENVPYLLYTFSRNGSRKTTIAFKGAQKSVGISSEYFRVARTEATAIIGLCSAASEEFCPAVGGNEIEIGTDIPSDQVVRLADKRAERKRAG
jgi:hypothetical protein